MMNCIWLLILVARNRFTRKDRGKMLAARPSRIRIRLQMMSSTLKDVLMVNTCMPMYRNTTVSAREGGERMVVWTRRVGRSKRKEKGENKGNAGFHKGFFSRGERLCTGKLISCGHRAQPPRAVWGHAPPGKF